MIPAAQVQRAMNGEESQLVGWRMARCAIGAAVPVARLRNGAIDADDDVAERQGFVGDDWRSNLVRCATGGAGSRWIRRWLKEREAQYICCAALLHLRLVQRSDLAVIDQGDDRLATLRRTREAQGALNEGTKFGSGDGDAAAPAAHDARAWPGAVTHPRAASAAVTFPERTFPSTRPLVFGASQPMTFPISFAEAAPVALIASATSASTSASLICSGM